MSDSTAPILVNFTQVSRAIRGAGGESAVALRELGARSHTGALDRAIAALEDAETDPDVMSSPDDRVAALLQSFVAERAVETGKVDAIASHLLEAKFDSHDWAGWAGSFFTWVDGLRLHDWLPAPTTPETVPNEIRLAVVGDWGTGFYGAPICARSILGDKTPFDAVIHLGDVYYSGTTREVEQRFLALWPFRPGAKNRALNSNHEMYTGGHAYYNTTLRRFGQNSSVFLMRNDHWLLVGLDTAYQEHDLCNGQDKWLADVIADAGGRRVVLLSHHQPYSLFEKGGARLVARLTPLLEGKRIFAWFWGHEHRCVLYDRHERWDMWGRCVGHSGFPYFRDDLGNAPRHSLVGVHEFRRIGASVTAPPALILDGPNPYVDGHATEYGPNGYLTLRFRDATLEETVHAADGTVLHEKRLA